MTDELEVIKFTEEFRQQWDEFVSTSRNGTFLHMRSFIEYHVDRFEDFSVLVMNAKNIVAVLPANRVADRIVSHSGLTFGGLIYGFDQKTVDVRRAFSKILAFYSEKGVSKVYYKTVPHIFHRYPAEDDLRELFVRGARLVRRDLSSVIDLSNRPKFSKSRQGGIKRAAKYGLKVVEGTFISTFHNLLSDVLKRHNSTPVHSISEMSLLQSRFPDKIRLIGAFEEERLLSAAWLFQFNDVLHTQYLACSDEGRKIGALDYLIASIIEGSPNSIKTISFGSSTEDNGHKINEGLLFQKEGFGARSIVLDHYELDIMKKGKTI